MTTKELLARCAAFPLHFLAWVDRTPSSMTEAQLIAEARMLNELLMRREVHDEGDD